MPNFVQISQTVAEIWRFFNFSSWRPSAILDFQKLEISTSGPIWRPNMRHRTKFCKDRSNRSRYMADFRFFKMAAVCHLGFLIVGHFNFRSRWEAQWYGKFPNFPFPFFLLNFGFPFFSFLFLRFPFFRFPFFRFPSIRIPLQNTKKENLLRLTN